VVLMTFAVAAGSLAVGFLGVDPRASAAPPIATARITAAAPVIRRLRLIDVDLLPAAVAGRSPSRHRTLDPLGYREHGRATGRLRPGQENTAHRCLACTASTCAFAQRWPDPRASHARRLGPGCGTSPSRHGTSGRLAARGRDRATARWRPGRES